MIHNQAGLQASHQLNPALWTWRCKWVRSTATRSANHSWPVGAMFVWARCGQEIDSKQQISSTRAAGPLHQDDAAVTTRAATGLVGWLE